MVGLFFVLFEIYAIQLIFLFFAAMSDSEVPESSKGSKAIQSKKEFYIWLIPYYIILRSLYKSISNYICSLD